MQHYAPGPEERARPYRGLRSSFWRVGETYVQVGGRWKYLFRVVDKHGLLIVSMLSRWHVTGATRRFLRKAVRVSDYPPLPATTDKLPSDSKTILRLPNDVVQHASRTTAERVSVLWGGSGFQRGRVSPQRPTKADAKIVVAYADITKNGPSTEADTSRTSEFLTIRIVRLLQPSVSDCPDKANQQLTVAVDMLLGVWSTTDRAPHSQTP